MCKFIKTLIITLLLTSSLSLNVKAESIMDINDLIENAKEIDGQEVTVQGEVIGERMDRGDYSWININDGTNAIGIWLMKSEAEQILYYGNYNNKGDTVEITGTFNRACIEHGGEADLHNNSIKIIEVGHIVKENISSVKVITTSILTVAALLYLLFYFKTVKSKTTVD